MSEDAGAGGTGTLLYKWQTAHNCTRHRHSRSLRQNERIGLNCWGDASTEEEARSAGMRWEVGGKEKKS